MSSQSSSADKSATSGIITNTATGERHIPASTRPDGSTRREIRVRPGYRPPEDVEVYKNRTAEAWKTRGAGGVPGADGLKENDGKDTASSSKNAKRREARKRAKAAEVEAEQSKPESNDLNGDLTKVPANVAERKQGREQDDPKATEGKDAATVAAQDKQARKLRKKLREARELQEKKNKGEGLLQEQFEKVIKINELIRDLDKLGFDANGEPKADNEGGSESAERV